MFVEILYFSLYAPQKIHAVEQDLNTDKINIYTYIYRERQNKNCNVYSEQKYDKAWRTRYL